MKFVELCVFDAKAPLHLRRPSSPPGAPGKGNPSGPKGDRAADGGCPAAPAKAANGLAKKAAAAASAAGFCCRPGSRPGKLAAEKRPPRPPPRERGEGRDTTGAPGRDGKGGEDDVVVVAAVDLFDKHILSSDGVNLIWKCS